MMRRLQMITIMACSLVWFVSSISPAGAWQNEYPEITVGVITEENAEDRQKRWQPFLDYMQDELGVDMTWREATDYAGVIQALKAKKIELAWFGPASFARAWIVTDKQTVPLAAEIDKDGGFGYYGVIIVRKDSPYQDLKDLEGVRFGFADPNSTSGHQAPRFFLEKEGIDVDNYFGNTTFSGSHESSVKMLMDGQFDAVATWWTNEKKSSMSRMEKKGMIEPGQYRIIWKSPRLPSDPFAVHADIPQEMKKDITKALLEMHKKDPQAFKALMGSSQRLKKVGLEDYQPVIDFVKANMQ
ncbi:MAG: phosphonate ABC transporter substrate-binding protein [Desulfovermiculus sp.]